ncbi:MAG: hypothetical protein AVDCRST_MAG05-929, partial [uncultured Rubrobacteraceae bacterium]
APTDDRRGAPGVPRRVPRGRAERVPRRPAAARHPGLVRLRARRKRHLLHGDPGSQVPEGGSRPRGRRAEPDGAAGGVPLPVRHRRGDGRRGGPSAVRGAGARRRPPVPARAARAVVRRGGARPPHARVRAVHGQARPLAHLRFLRRGGV